MSISDKLSFEHILIPVSRRQNMFSDFLLKMLLFFQNHLYSKEWRHIAVKSFAPKYLSGTFRSVAICVVLWSIDVNYFPPYIDKPFRKSSFCFLFNMFGTCRYIYQYCSYMKLMSSCCLTNISTVLVKQQNDSHIVWLHYGIHDKMKTLSCMVRCSYK